MITRFLESKLKKTKKSVLLLGPRQVGKSTLIHSLQPDLEINLADEIEFLRHSSAPEELQELILRNDPTTVYIDEIQRLPKLLNTIQMIVDQNKSLKFYLTGSSARKLKRGEANLLPGRLVSFHLGPFAACEFDYGMNSTKILEFGSLPEIYLSDDETENKLILGSYAANYIKEEIKAEALVRNLDSFARFFTEAVSMVAEFIDHTKLAKKSKISRHAIPRYFEILEDTLIGYRVFPFLENHALDVIKHPKFYFFDNGIYNGLLRNYVASADRIGKLAEQLIFSQVMHSASAKDLSCSVYSFRTRQNIEVDFVFKIQNEIFAVEVKTSGDLQSSDLQGLDYFDKEISAKKKLLLLHLASKEKKYGKIWALPWQKGLHEMGL